MPYRARRSRARGGGGRARREQVRTPTGGGSRMQIQPVGPQTGITPAGGGSMLERRRAEMERRKAAGPTRKAPKYTPPAEKTAVKRAASRYRQRGPGDASPEELASGRHLSGYSARRSAANKARVLRQKGKTVKRKTGKKKSKARKKYKSRMSGWSYS